MRPFLFLLLIVLIIAGVLLGPSAFAFYQSQGPLPGGVTLGGMTPQGETLEDVARNLHETFQQPVAVYFDDQRIILRPDDVDFQVDVNSMVAEAVPYGEGIGFWRPFLGEGVRPARPQPVDIPLKMTFDEAEAGRLAGQRGRRSTTGRPTALRRGAGARNALYQHLHVPGWPAGSGAGANLSAQRVVQALSSPTNREANLVLVEVPPPPPSIKELEKLLVARSDRFPGIVSLFVRQVGGDEEVAIDPDIAFAGMSIMKIPMMMELYRSVIDGTPDVETTKLLSDTLGAERQLHGQLDVAPDRRRRVGNEWQGATR